MCRDRRQVDDGTTAAAQAGEGRPRETNGAHQDQIEGFAPGLVVELGDGSQDGPARVVDQHLEPTQGANRPLDEVAALVGLPDIGDPRHDVIALVA